MRQHKFQAEGRRLADMILFYSHERGRPRAVVPAQAFFGVVLGMPKGKVSEGMSWLLDNHVAERELVRVTVQDRELKWMSYWLCPPAQWSVQRRVSESAALTEVEEWLERLDLMQPELLPPPPSLSQLLAEDFAERAALGGSRVEACGLSAGQRSPGGNSAGVEMVSKSSPGASFVAPSSRGVPPEGTLSSGPPGQKVPPEGTLAVPREGTLGAGEGARAYAGAGGDRVDQDRLIDSIKGLSRSGIDPRARAGSSPGGNSNYRAYVEERLFKAIGQHERAGLSGSMWQRALDEIPDELDELLSFGIEAKKLGRIRKSLPAWLNSSTRSALAVAAGKGAR